MPFDIGESYGGVLPVGSSNNGSVPSGNTTEQQLYFWFFPSENPAATDEVLIWLNGGVSCLYLSFRECASLSVKAAMPPSSHAQRMLTYLTLARLFQSHRARRKRTVCVEGWHLAACRKPLVLESFDKPSLYASSAIGILACN